MSRRTPSATGRGRTLVVAGIALGVALAVPLLVWQGAHTIANSTEGRTASTVAEAALQQLPPTPGALLVSVDDAGQVAGLTVFALAPGGAGGTAVVVPAGTQADVAGQDHQVRLATAYDGGGMDAQVEATEGFLGVSFAVTQEAHAADLAALLAPLAPIHLDIDAPVLSSDASGREVVAFPKGAVTLTADEAARFLLAHGPNESELARLARIDAFWKAALTPAGAAASTATATTTVAGATPAAPTTVAVPAGDAPAAPTDVAGFLAGLRSGPAAVRQLTVQPVVNAQANPDGQDLLAPDVAEVRLLMAEVLPGAVSTSNGNLRWRIINPTGDPELSYDAVQRLVFVGANVILVVEPSEAAPAQTEIRYQSADEKADATTYAPVLGTTLIAQDGDRIDGIDATVTLGQDFAPFIAAEQAKTAAGATTTTTTPTSSGSTPADATTTTLKENG